MSPMLPKSTNSYTLKLSKLIMVLVALAAFSQVRVSAQVRERTEVAVADTWNLQDICVSDEAWEKDKRKLAAQLDEILSYRGKLGKSAEELRACMELNSDISREFVRLNSYASMKSDEDTRISKNLGMRQELRQLMTDYSSKGSFIEPEITRIEKSEIEKFIEEEPGLKIYRMYLYDIQRTKAHRLSEKEEKILAEAGLMADGPATIYRIFSNAELPFPEIELSDGTTAHLNQAGYSRYRALPNRADREAVFGAFWETYNKFKQTFGVQLYANVKKDMFYARTRDYESSLHRALDSDNIPTEVYMTLIENVNNNLGLFHEYLNLKKQMLGVDVLKYSDVYAPVVKGVELEYTYEEAKKLVLDSAKWLGQE